MWLVDNFKLFFWMFNIACIQLTHFSLYWHYPKGMVLFIGTLLHFCNFLRNRILIQLKNINLSKLHSKVIHFYHHHFFHKNRFAIIKCFPVLGCQSYFFKTLFCGRLYTSFHHWIYEFILLWLYKFPQTARYKSALGLLIAGFIFTELLLFYQGASVLLQFKYFPPFSMVVFRKFGDVFRFH